VACASCHLPEHGWSDPRQFSLRYDGRPTARHAPTILNRAFGELQQWTGARRSLEDQAMKSSDSNPDTVVRQLGAIPGYQEQFQRVFGTGVTAENVAKAISAFERTILSGNSPHDRFVAGDRTAMSPAAQRGFALFVGKARCAACHHGSNLTDEAFHNVGVGMDRPNPDLGRFDVTKKDEDRGAFKTPTLRDVAKRPPYMHDGSVATLREVVAFYNRAGTPNPTLSPLMTALGLSEAEEADLVAFLDALTGEVDPTVASRPTLPADK
jgi:cytochrome c peroxidase